MPIAQAFDRALVACSGGSDTTGFIELGTRPSDSWSIVLDRSAQIGRQYFTQSRVSEAHFLTHAYRSRVLFDCHPASVVTLGVEVTSSTALRNDAQRRRFDVLPIVEDGLQGKLSLVSHGVVL